MNVQRSFAIMRFAVPVAITLVLTFACFVADMSDGCAQELQNQDPLPPVSWRSSASSSLRIASPQVPLLRTPDTAPPSSGRSVKRISAQQIETPVPLSASTLSAELQAEKRQRLLKISKRLQRILNVGPECGTESVTPGDSLFPSERSPFFPPITSPLDNSSPTARTMPEQKNTGAMKDGDLLEGDVPDPQEVLPVLPQIENGANAADDKTKPVGEQGRNTAISDPTETQPSVSESATTEAGTTATVTAGARDDATDDTTDDETSTGLSPEGLPGTAANSTGMPAISEMIDSLIQETDTEQPEEAKGADESPMSATTVLDSPVDRLRLSDSLFASKEFTLALQMYESLDRKSLAESERYWVMYQKASCLRRLDATAEAQTIYRQLAGDANAGWLAGLSRWWLDRISDRLELRVELDKVANVLSAVQEAKDAGTFN